MSGGPERAVRLADVSVSFPGQQPSLSVDLDVDAGEHVLLRGASGCGKSTLLRLLTGVVPQAVDAHVAGRVRVLGHDPRTLPVAVGALRVGWLGQDPAAGTCLPTVEAEVALPLENRGVARDRIGARVRQALADVGAAHLVGRRTAELSGGEQQRVALAAVLVGEPELLLLDEPTSMLDPVGAHLVRELIGRHAQGRGVVLVEHRVTGPGWLPERAVTLDGGRVVADGPVGDVTAPRPVRASRVAGGEPVLRLRAAAWSQGGHAVVRDVDLDLVPGEVTAVVGCNGSGKSSLLLGMAGLLDGAPPTRRPATGRPAVGLVFQRPEHQVVGRTVRADLAHGLLAARGLRRPDDAVAAAVDEMLRRVDLAHLADRDPFRLSGGEQRRLSVAAMAVLDRPVMLLDEPTFGLDDVQTASVLRLVDTLAARGTAVVVATHDLAIARWFADRVLVLAEGRPLAAGRPELLDDPGLLVEAGLRLPEPVAVGR